MKKLFLFVFVILSILLLSLIHASEITKNGIKSGINVDTKPLVFKCGNTTYWDDNTEPGRVSEGHQDLVERKGKYLFEGEQIYWKVLVADFNGINSLNGVYATLGDTISPNNQIEVNCIKSDDPNQWYQWYYINSSVDFNSCNLRDFKDKITGFDNSTMAYYNCVLTVETSESMYGKNWITVEAKDVSGSVGIMPEAEQWFLNPVIALTIDNDFIFENISAGKTIYSNEVTVGNGADEGSGVVLDMFITGTGLYSLNETDFCPVKQILPLDRFKFYAEKGSVDTSGIADSDSEGYLPLKYGIGFNNPVRFYNYAEIIPKNNDPKHPMYYLTNQLGPEDNMKIKLKIDVPKLCKGNFDQGAVYFWGEAI